MLGAHLLYFLLEKGLPVRAIHREYSNLSAVKNIFSLYTSDPNIYYEKIDWVEADIIDIPTLTEAFEGIEYVYHCAAFVSFDPSKYRQLKKINVEGTANIVNLCLAKSVKKLCYVSSVSTFGKAVSGKSVFCLVQTSLQSDCAQPLLDVPNVASNMTSPF